MIKNMSDITNNRTDSVSIQERVRIAQEAKAKLDAEIAENNRLLEELRKAEEALLNDPVERAKSLADANKMIEAGIKEYEAESRYGAKKNFKGPDQTHTRQRR